MLAGAAWPARAFDHAFQITSLVLYLPNQALVERGPPVADLTAYINALKAKADAVLTQAPAGVGASGSLVIGLKPPARSRVWIVMPDKTRQPEFAALLKGPLEAIQAPAVQGLNAFAINFNAWGGAQPPPKQTYPVPDEWVEAMRKSGQTGILPDAPMRMVWPD